MEEQYLLKEEEFKLGYTDSQISQAQEIQLEKSKRERLIMSTRRIRITSGGKQRDFIEEEHAINYLKKSVRLYAYAGVHVIHPELFWKGEAPDIKPIIKEIQ